jgi:hypothetical protein
MHVCSLLFCEKKQKIGLQLQTREDWYRQTTLLLKLKDPGDSKTFSKNVAKKTADRSYCQRPAEWRFFSQSDEIVKIPTVRGIN